MFSSLRLRRSPGPEEEEMVGAGERNGAEGGGVARGYQESGGPGMEEPIPRPVQAPPLTCVLCVFRQLAPGL